MREIKFREWNDIKGGWVVFKGSLPFTPEEPFNIMDLTPLPGVTIEQYTGLKDKNGREIYEGDIVRHCVKGGNITWIEYREDIAAFERFSKNGPAVLSAILTLEVIGNIHENPELLGVTESHADK